MAYNPFNIFRRNQKAIFAVVTVVIMFMFVLSSGMSGKADLFNRIPEWFSNKKTGQALCTLDGSKIYSRDLEQVRRQRAMASRFMEYAAGETTENLQKVLLDQMSKGSPEFKQMFQFALTNPQMSGMVLDMMAKSTKQTDKDAAKTLEAIMTMNQHRMRPGNYFASVPNRSGYDRDTIEFLIWEEKAKQLGIDFSTDDVKLMVQKEFMGQFTNEVQVRKQLEREMQGFSLDACWAALAAEFRVRAAQTAIFGPVSERGDRTLTAAPIFTPPFELFDFYRDKTSTTNYEVLRVPVEAFIPLVKELPSETELQRLFTSRKEYEPDPSKEQPGFKDPRKVKVEWVSATGEEPYYKTRAAEWVKLTEQLAKSEVRGLLVPIAGMGPAAWWAQFAAPAALKEPLVQEKYRHDVADVFENKIRFGWSGPSTFVMPYDMLDTSFVKPQNLAAAVGGAAGSIGFGNPFLAPAELMYTATVAAEQRARIKAAMPFFLGSIPGPSMLPTMVGSEVAFRKSIPEPLPLEAFKPELLKEISEAKARSLAKADLESLKKSIDELKETGKSRESAAKDLIADFIKTRGIKTGSSQEFQSEFTIGDDPGLSPLKAVLDKEKNPHGEAAAPVQFGKKFFWKQSTNGLTREMDMGNYKPEFYETPNSGFGKVEPIFLAWRTADQIARELSNTTARPRVIEAWKRMKARDLAKAEAERLANEIRNKPGESDVAIRQNLADLEAQLKAITPDAKAKEKVKLFPVGNVAPYQIIPDFSGGGFNRGGGGDRAQPFSLPPSTNIPYPTSEMAEALLKDRTKPVKTVLVEADQPKDSYYVAVLMGRHEKFPEDFRRDVFNALDRGGVSNAIRNAYRMDAGGKAHETILALLKKEFRYTETDEQKKRLDDREKKGNSEE